MGGKAFDRAMRKAAEEAHSRACRQYVADFEKFLQVRDLLTKAGKVQFPKVRLAAVVKADQN